jgi:hypothetical protein
MRVKYGLMRRCESDTIVMPGGEYQAFDCRPFPGRDAGECEDADGYNTGFCAAWTTASYVEELGIGFGAVAVLAIVFGLSTHSRRRRIWKAVAWLVALHGAWPTGDLSTVLELTEEYSPTPSIALCQLITFAIVTHVFVHRSYAGFDRARPGEHHVTEYSTLTLTFR